MIGSLIGAGLNVAGSIIGGISARKAMRKQRELLRQKEQNLENWWTRKEGEDFTQRASAQRAITLAEERLKRANKAAAGAQAVMGGTIESVDAAQENNAKALADMTGNIAAKGEEARDAAEQQYLTKKDAIEDAKMNLQANKAAAVSEAVKGVTSAAGDIAMNLDSTDDETKKF